MMENDLEEIKLYSDYKSPYSYLAFDPGFALEEKYRVRVRWIPFQLRIKGKGERSVYSEYKVKYSYLDARRWANMRGGLALRGPLKIYDTRPVLIGGLLPESTASLWNTAASCTKRFSSANWKWIRRTLWLRSSPTWVRFIEAGVVFFRSLSGEVFAEFRLTHYR